MLVMRLQAICEGITARLLMRDDRLHSHLAIPHQSCVTCLYKVFVIGKCFKNNLLFHDLERYAIRLAPLLVRALFIECQSSLELHTGLGNDGSVWVLIEIPDEVHSRLSKILTPIAARVCVSCYFDGCLYPQHSQLTPGPEPGSESHHHGLDARIRKSNS